MRSIYDFSNTLGATSATEIDELTDRCQSLEQRIASLNESYETLKKREVDLTEWRWVLREAGGFFDRVWNILHMRGTGLQLTRVNRLEARQRRYVNRWTTKTTMRHYYRMSNSTVRMGTHMVATGLFQS